MARSALAQAFPWRDPIRRDFIKRLAVVVALGVSASASRAASIAPPMLDITHQCDTTTRHNMRAMSECVVAESEARSEILQKWDRVSDANAQRCVTVGRKSRRLPYSAIAKCLAVEPVVLPTPPAPAASAPAPGAPAAKDPAKDVTKDKDTSAFSGWKRFFSSDK